VVRQFLNARRQGPIGMAEEKDAAELAAEKEEGEEIPPLPPIPPQITPSNGEKRRTQREPGEWLRENNVDPPPGSFAGEEGYGAAAAPTAPPASTENSQNGSQNGAYPDESEDAEPTQRLRRSATKTTSRRRSRDDS